MAKAEVFYLNRGKKYNCEINGTPYFRKSKKIGGKMRTFYGDGEKDCLAKIKAAEDLANSGLNYDNKDARISDVFETWLMNIKRVDKNLKASSFTKYETAFRTHIKPYDIYQSPIRGLTAAQMQEYVNFLYEEKNLSGSTIKYAIRVWRMFYDWAIKEGYALRDPSQNISLPGKRDKMKRHFETFDEEERAALVKEIVRSDYWYGMMVLLAFDTGMRQGELLGLRWEDITEDGVNICRSTALVVHTDKDGNRERYREVWDTKTVNSERFIPIRKEMYSALLKFKVEREEYFSKKGMALPEYVFTTNTGCMVDASSFAKSYKRLVERTGIEYRKFHAIRHTFATEAIRQGVNIKDLQMLMGHSNIETTLLYVQSSEESKKNAINKMISLVGV